MKKIASLLLTLCLVCLSVAVLAEAVPCGRLPALLGGLSDAAALLMGMLGSSALMLFLSFTLAMKAVAIG